MLQQHTYNAASNLYTPNPFLLSSGWTLSEPGEISTMALRIQKLAADWEWHHAVVACEVKTLKAQISRNAEKVEFYDDLANTSQLFNAFEVANLLGTGRNRLLKFMREHKILMSNVHRLNAPYQKHKNAGRFEVKASRHKNHQTGAIEIKLTTLFTGKGVIWLQKYIVKHGRSKL